MSTVRPHLYINSKGYNVNRHSYSGSESFHFCARKYYLERVQGWGEREQRSSSAFGTALEKAITYWHQHRQDTQAARAEFARLWLEHKDKPYKYTKSDLDWDRLNLTGDELLRLYTIRYPTFPYVVNNPLDFQVETTFEVFPGTKLEGLQFTSYIDLLASVKPNVPWIDYTQFTPGSELIIDMKTSGKDVPEFTVLDPQLRSYAWVRRRPEDPPTPVAFLWFRKMGREISRGDVVAFLDAYAGYQPGDSAVVLATDEFGLMVASEERLLEEMRTLFIGESKAVKAARQEFVSANAKLVPESAITKQRVQFKMERITPDSAEDIGRSIKRDMINIVNANEKEFWPMQSGVRFPNEKCPMCCMRGICANKPDLRDALLTRKQVDEFADTSD